MEDMNLDELRSVLNELRPKCEARVSAGFKKKVMQEAESRHVVKVGISKLLNYKYWSIAAMVIIVCTIAYPIINATNVSANSLLETAIANFDDIRTMVMILDVRTKENENFNFVSPDEDYVRHSISVIYDEPMLWRIDKSNTRSAFGIENDNYAWINKYKIGAYKPGNNECILQYMSILLYPKNIMQRELNNMLRHDKDVKYSIETYRDDIVLTVHSQLPNAYKAGGVLLNKEIESSENIRKYVFDRKNMRLKNLQVYMVVDGQKIEVIRTQGIQYNVSLSRPELMKIPEYISIDYLDFASNRLSGLSAIEAANIILNVFEQWDTDILDVAMGHGLSMAMQAYYKGCHLKSLGTPFVEGSKSQTFIPYSMENPKGDTISGILVMSRFGDTWKLVGGL